MAGLDVGRHEAHQPLEARLDVRCGHLVAADDAQPADLPGAEGSAEGIRFQCLKTHTLTKQRL